MKFRFFFASDKGERRGYVSRFEARRLLGEERYNDFLQDAERVFALNPEEYFYTIVAGGTLEVELENQSIEVKKMKVKELKKALRGISDDLEVVVSRPFSERQFETLTVDDFSVGDTSGWVRLWVDSCSPAGEAVKRLMKGTRS